MNFGSLQPSRAAREGESSKQVAGFQVLNCFTSLDHHGSTQRVFVPLEARLLVERFIVTIANVHHFLNS